MAVVPHETRSRQFLEQLVGREHASRMSRRNGPIDNTQVATFTWSHALRDLIQNGLPSDSGAANFEITVDPKAGTAVLRDDGSGYSLYRQFTCSTGKLESETAAGLFGRGGTKEAPLTLALHDVVVAQRSRDWATVALATPYPDEGVTLLEFDHVTGLPPQKGTTVHLSGLTPEMVAYLQRPEENFLYFREKRGWKPKYVSPSGDSIVSFEKGEVFIRGVKVTDYPHALFGYNFKSIRAPIGRERDKFDESEVSSKLRMLYATCTDAPVLDALLTLGSQERYTVHKLWNPPSIVEFASLPYDPEETVKTVWRDRFAAVFGENAILTNRHTDKNKERLAHVARAQGKNPVLLHESLAHRLHKFGIPYDSDLTANYEDIMWTNGELEQISPGTLVQVDIPLHMKGERVQAGTDFHIVYAAAAAQAIQNPQRTRYDITFIVYDSARRTQVVKREYLGEFFFKNFDVNYTLKNPEDPRITSAEDLQQRLDACYSADSTKQTISAERVASLIQQVRVALPRTAQSLDIREIGDVYKQGQQTPYFVTPQLALAELANHSLAKGDVMVVKADDWIAVPTKRETTLPNGEKVVHTVFDTWRGVPDDGQYIALTDRRSICDFLQLGESVLSLRAQKPHLIEKIEGRIPDSVATHKGITALSYERMVTGTIAEVYSPAHVTRTEIFIDGFLVQEASNTLFTYNVNSADTGINPLYYFSRDHSGAGHIVHRVIPKTKDKAVIKKILQEATALQRNERSAKLPLELTPYEKYDLDDAVKKVWREAFIELFGKEAVVATDATVTHGNWLQYYCDADRSYHALAQRFGHKPIKFVSGIEKTLIDAGAISDMSAFEHGVDYTVKTDLTGKTKSAYDLAVAAVGKIQEHVNRDAERKHTYEVHFFTGAKLTATGAVAKNLTYAKRLEAKKESEDITHHIYINVKEADKITSIDTAKQYVANLMRLALDEGTARDFAIRTVTADLDGAIKVAGGYQTAWQRLVGSFGGGKK